MNIEHFLQGTTMPSDTPIRKGLAGVLTFSQEFCPKLEGGVTPLPGDTMAIMIQNTDVPSSSTNDLCQVYAQGLNKYSSKITDIISQLKAALPSHMSSIPIDHISRLTAINPGQKESWVNNWKYGTALLHRIEGAVKLHPVLYFEDSDSMLDELDRFQDQAPSLDFSPPPSKRKLEEPLFTPDPGGSEKNFSLNSVDHSITSSDMPVKIMGIIVSKCSGLKLDPTQEQKNNFCGRIDRARTLLRGEDGKLHCKPELKTLAEYEFGPMIYPIMMDMTLGLFMMEEKYPPVASIKIGNNQPKLIQNNKSSTIRKAYVKKTLDRFTEIINGSDLSSEKYRLCEIAAETMLEEACTEQDDAFQKLQETETTTATHLLSMQAAAAGGMTRNRQQQRPFNRQGHFTPNAATFAQMTAQMPPHLGQHPNNAHRQRQANNHNNNRNHQGPRNNNNHAENRNPNAVRQNPA